MLRCLFPAVLALILLGCRQQADDLSNTFVYNESDGVSGLDPAFASQLEDMWVCNQLFDGLVALDGELNIIPSVSRAWEIDDSGTEYTFHLRDDVWFHAPADGLLKERKVIAADFVFSFERLLSPELASPGRWIFSEVDTSHPHYFEATDDSTLVIRLKRPFAQFLGILTTQFANVVMPEAVNHYGKDFRFHPVGSGPFRFAFWEQSIALILHRNPHYWMRDEQGLSLPYLDAVKVEFAADMSTEYYGLLSGRYDMMSGIHPSFKDELLDASGELNPVFASKLKLQHTPFIKTDYIGLLVDSAAEGMENHPLLDVRVRKALDLAIDKNRMVRFLRNNAVYPANEGFVPHGLAANRSSVPQSHNLKMTEKLLEEAGYPKGKGMPELTLTATSDNADILEFVQHQWSLVGIQCRIDILPAPTLKEMVAKSRVKIFKRSWLADYADAENFFTLFYSPNFSPNGPNYMHYKNPEFDSIYELSRKETSFEKRQSHYSKMDSILRGDCPVIPLFYDRVTHFLQLNITNFETNPVNMLDLVAVKKN